MKSRCQGDCNSYVCRPRVLRPCYHPRNPVITVIPRTTYRHEFTSEDSTSTGIPRLLAADDDDDDTAAQPQPHLLGPQLVRDAQSHRRNCNPAPPRDRRGTEAGTTGPNSPSDNIGKNRPITIGPMQIRAGYGSASTVEDGDQGQPQHASRTTHRDERMVRATERSPDNNRRFQRKGVAGRGTGGDTWMHRCSRLAFRGLTNARSEILSMCEVALPVVPHASPI